jgi:hypothetical protein
MSGLEILAIVIGLAILGLLLKQAYVLNQKHHKIQTKAASLEDENARLLTTQSELSSEAKRLQVEVDRLTAENQGLKKLSLALENLDVAKTELEQVSINLTQRKRDQVNLDQQISQSEERLQKLRIEEEILKSIYAETQKAKTSLEEQKTSLNHVIFSLQRKKEKTQNDYDDLKTQLDSIEDQCEQGKQRLEDLRKAMQRVELKINDLENHKAQLSQENQRLKESNESLKDTNQSLQSNDELIRRQNELRQAKTILESEKKQLKDQLTQSQQHGRQYYQALHRIKIISACRQHSTSEQELFHAKITIGFNRVSEALDFAEMMFGNVLEIWDSARDSAYAFHQFIRPDDVYRTLQSLAWFGQYYFDQNGDIGNNLHDFLKEHYGLTSSGEGETTRNGRKSRGERCFRHGNQSKEMLKHIKLGGGVGAKMDNVLRIYYDINREHQKIEIGHCGKHPSN